MFSDELIRLRTEKVEPGEQRTSDIPIPPDPGRVGGETTRAKRDEERESDVNQVIPDEEPVHTQPEARESPSVAELKEVEAAAEGSDAKTDEPEPPESSTSEPTDDEAGTLNDAKETANENVADKPATSDQKVVADIDMTAEQQPEDASPSNKNTEAPEPADPSKSPVSASGAGTSSLKEEDDCSEEDDEGKSAKSEDDDSDAVVGIDDAVKLDQDLMVEDDYSDLAETDKPNRKVSVLFQKLLHLGGSSGQVTLNISDKDTERKYAKNIRLNAAD